MISKQHVFFLIVTLAAVAGFARMGIWQLDRADEKDAVIAEFDAAAAAPPLPITEHTPLDSADVFRDAEATGQYVSQSQFLLNYQVRNHQNGFEVLTPFLLGESKLILVNRGWVPHAGDYRVLPDIAVSEGSRSIAGYLVKEPGIGMKLGEPQMNDAWPSVIQYVDWPHVSSKFPNLSVIPYIMRLSADAPDGYLRDWQLVAFSSDKHRGYALQWFSFAALAIVLYLLYLFRWSKTRGEKRNT